MEDHHPERPAVDFIKGLADMSVFHVIDAICQYLPPETLAGMHEVCQSWNKALLDSGSAARRRRQHSSLKSKVMRWREASKSCEGGDLLESDDVCDGHFTKFHVEAGVHSISHDLVFTLCDSASEEDEEEFSVMRLTSKSLTVVKTFRPKTKADKFRTSCDYHKSALDSEVFITRQRGEGHQLWNLNTGTSAEILPALQKDGKASGVTTFTFNSRHLMVVWPSKDSETPETLKLFRLDWTEAGEFAGKVLVDEMEGLGCLTKKTPLKTCGRKILILNEKEKTGMMVTFEEGKLKVVWRHRDDCFANLPMRNLVLVTDTHLFIFDEDDFSCAILSVDGAKVARCTPASRLPTHDDTFFEAQPFGRIGLSIDWYDGEDGRKSMLLLEEILEHGSLSTPLLGKTSVSFPSFSFNAMCSGCGGGAIAGWEQDVRILYLAK